MNITNPISNLNSNRWTASSIECLKNHCICSKCNLRRLVHNCRMKSVVLDLYRKTGRPEGYQEPLFEV